MKKKIIEILAFLLVLLMLALIYSKGIEMREELHRAKNALEEMEQDVKKHGKHSHIESIENPARYSEPVTSVDDVDGSALAYLDAIIEKNESDDDIGCYIAQHENIPPKPRHFKDEMFREIDSEWVKTVAKEPISNISIYVDNSSYPYIRRQLNNGELPELDEIRIEEMLNYFDYDYPSPYDFKKPFKIKTNVYTTPWNVHTKLMHIGIKGYENSNDKPRSNLVFLLDISGSMNDPEKLPLLRDAFLRTIEHLNPDGTVSIVTYAGRSASLLKSTKLEEKDVITNVFKNLNSGGDARGTGGIKEAYELAEKAFVKDGINKVILVTDGDFNVGIFDIDKLKNYVKSHAEKKIYFSIIGFGRGDYDDALMHVLSKHGNGKTIYIDTVNEAEKFLFEEATSCLFPIAKDVKIEVEFNPKMVSDYHLIGYAKTMFDDEKIDEDHTHEETHYHDVFSGHTLTAIYEITPVKKGFSFLNSKDYQKMDEKNLEYANINLSYILPNENKERLISVPITKGSEVYNFDRLSKDVRFAAGIAAFGEMLRGDRFLSGFTYDDVVELLEETEGEDPFGYRAELLDLVKRAKNNQKEYSHSK